VKRTKIEEKYCFELNNLLAEKLTCTFRVGIYSYYITLHSNYLEWPK